jgi:hypothetical protein
MPSNRHDGGDKQEQRWQGTIALFVAAAGALAGYGITIAKGWAANSKFGAAAAGGGTLIGTCVALLVYGLCRIFLRR